MKVAFLGPEGTFSQIAALEVFGDTAELIGSPTILEVFRAVSSGKADLGIVPLENLAEGLVPQTLEGFLETKLRIRSQKVIPIRQCLVTRAKSLSEVRRVYSHPHALKQCRKYLAQSLPEARILETASTSAAARLALDEPDAAAISSELAAKLIGLPVLEENIQDHEDNSSRFVVISGGFGTPPFPSRPLTALLVPCPKGAASIPDIRKSFEDNRVPILRLEPFPATVQTKTRLYFALFEGGEAQPGVASLLQDLEKLGQGLQILGTFDS